MKTNKIVMLLFMAITMGMMMSCETSTQRTTSTETRKVVDFTTVEGVKSGIEGTVWTYTEPLTSGFKLWFRLEFKGGRAYLSQAIPSDGSWGEAKVENYTVGESYDAITGEKRVEVKIGGYNTFVPKTGRFNYWGMQQCTMKQQDYKWD